MSISPFVNSAAWDVIVVGGVTCPGYCKLDKVARKNEFDRKKGKGTQGETLTYVQKPAAEIKVTFYLWTTAHFVSWDSFRQLLKYDPTKKSVEAIEIYHPALADLEIHSVVTASLGVINHEGKGLFTVEVDLIEYFPPAKKSATSTPDKSNSATDPKSTPGNTGNDAQSQLDAENRALLAEAQKQGAL